MHKEEKSPEEKAESAPFSSLLHKVPQSVVQYTVIGLVCIIAIGAWIIFGRNKDAVETLVPDIGPVTEIAEFSASVVPADKVELGFEVSGKLLGVPVEVGDSVSRGSVLARLTSAGEEALVRRAEADLLSAEAYLRDLERGPIPEEVDLQKTRIAQSQQSLSDAQTAMNNALESAFTLADDAVRNVVDNFFRNPKSLTPELIFNTEFQLETNLESGRAVIERELRTWQTKMFDGVSKEDENAVATEAKGVLEKIKAFLADLSFAVNDANPTAEYSLADITAWKNSVSGARTSIDGALTNLIAKQEALNTARTNVRIQEEQLIVLEAGVTEDILDRARGDVLAKKAQKDEYESNVKKRILTSPLSGVVSSVNVSSGESVQAHENIVTVISDAAFEIKAQVSELDIAHIRVGNTAKVTLDSYGDSVFFDAVVTHIDPAETRENNVSTYGITIEFGALDERIKSGMTAHVFLVTRELAEVLRLPVRAVKRTQEGMGVVRTLSGEGEIVEKEVLLGLLGSNGYIEVISGISLEDRIIDEL